MSYDLYPILSIFIAYFCLPLFLKNKKIFFKKNFFLFKKATIDVNLIILKITYIHFAYTIFYLFVTTFWNDIVFSNMYGLVLYSLIFIVTYMLMLQSTNITSNTISWELSFALCGATLITPFFFLKLSLFQYFFITEIIAAFLFFIIYYKSIQNKTNCFNKTLSINVVYFQLLLNSLVAIAFTTILIYINLYALFKYTNIFWGLLVLVLVLKVGIGPAFFFKWYIFKSLSILISSFLSIIYLFIYLFFIHFLYNYVTFRELTYIVGIIFVFNSLIIFLFYNRVVVGSSFLQYSSSLTYGLFLLFLPIF